MTVRELVRNIEFSLNKIYSELQAKFIAEWLIMDVLKVEKRHTLFEMLDNIIEDKESLLKVIKQKLRRLLRNEPIQYVTHKAWFYGMEFFVNRYVLIPRPETEELCNKILQDNINTRILNVIDIGTGSGCIAITLKKNCTAWNVYATDISEDALTVAKCNSKKHMADIIILNDDIFNSKLYYEKIMFDIIVCNPPYIPVQEKPSLPINVVNYEPHLALFVTEPLLYYRAIVEFAKIKLTKNGLIYVELHENYFKEVIELFKENLFNVLLFYDINNKPRYIKALKQ